MIHNEFLQIAGNYEISNEQMGLILESMKIKDTSSTPSSEQLEGFEKICCLIEEGTEPSSAISLVIESAKQKAQLNSKHTEVQGQKETEVKMSSFNEPLQNQIPPNPSSDANNTDNSSNLDNIIQRQAEQAVKKALANLPNLGKKEYEQIKSKFVSKFREQFIKQLLGSNFQEDFANYVEADMEEYNQQHLKYIESLPLLNSSVDSSKTSALPPGQ